MGNTDFDEAIREAYATAPTDEIILDTLEFRHDSFVDDYGNPTAIRVVRDYDDLIATLESDAPLNPGEEVTFTAFPFDVVLPKIDDGGVSEIQIVLDNVGGVVIQYFDQAILSNDPVEMTYRPYRTTDLSAPQMDPVTTLSVVNIEVDAFRITATARFNSVQNVRFPRVDYTLDDFPALA